jgi:Fe-S-cluster containining protein
MQKSSFPEVYGFIEDLKQEELSEYCLNKCKRNRCCTDLNRFTLILDKERIALLYGDKLREEHPEESKTRNGQERILRSKINQLVSEGALFRRKDGLFWYTGPVCPRYDEETKKCEVHKHYKRPGECASFPLSLEKGEVIMDGRCDFIKSDWGEIFSTLDKNYPQDYASIKIRCSNSDSDYYSDYHCLPKDIEEVRKVLARADGMKI